MQYRYSRIAANYSFWVRPVAGRLKNEGDYVGRHGFGYEDWNFAGDLWSDGNLHLYLQDQPAQKDMSDTFNIVLGCRIDGEHRAVGICLNATYTSGSADLPNDVRLRRAQELHELERHGQLAGPLYGLSVKTKAKQLLDSGEVCWVTVKSKNLIKLETPVPIPHDIINRASYRYSLEILTKSQFETIRMLANSSKQLFDPEHDSFPEGALVARSHLVRERNQEVVKIAKAKFRALHGNLHCEACNWPKGSPLQDIAGMADAIEAHHDIPLSSVDHSGQTSPDDLRMLCPTCHRAIHRLRPWLKTSEFKAAYFPD